MPQWKRQENYLLFYGYTAKAILTSSIFFAIIKMSYLWLEVTVLNYATLKDNHKFKWNLKSLIVSLYLRYMHFSFYTRKEM